MRKDIVEDVDQTPLSKKLDRKNKRAKERYINGLARRHHRRTAKAGMLAFGKKGGSI